MKKWLLIAAGLLVAVIVVVVVVGSLLSREHRAARQVVLQQSPETLFATITAYEDAPSWREDIASVRREQGPGGTTVWVEVSRSGDEIGYETAESRPPNHLVRRIVGKDLPFGGTWTFEITPEGDGSRIKITEDGYVDNPIFRFVSAVFIGHTLFMDRYLTFLGRKFGEVVEPIDA